METRKQQTGLWAGIVALAVVGVLAGFADRVFAGPVQYQFTRSVGNNGTGDGEFASNGSNALAVDSSGKVWVADNGNYRIQEFSNSGKYLSQFGSNGTGDGRLVTVSDVALDPLGNVCVADIWNNRVLKFDSNGNYLMQFGTYYTGNGLFYDPRGVAVDSSGNIWVAEDGDRLQEFNSSGVYLTQFGSHGTGNGQFNDPVAVAVDSAGNIWVADNGNSRIEKFNSSGDYLTQFGSYGTGNGQFDYPSHVAVDSLGNVWVADTNNYRIVEFSPVPEPGSLSLLVLGGLGLIGPMIRRRRGPRRPVKVWSWVVIRVSDSDKGGRLEHAIEGFRQGDSTADCPGIC